MRVSDDYEDEMRPPRPLDDATVDLILAGEPVGDDGLLAVAAFVADLRSSATSSPPPSAALAAVLAGGVATIDHGGVVPTSARRAARPLGRGSSWAGRRPRLLPRLLSVFAVPVGTAGVGAKAAFGLAMAAASVTAAGAADILPDPVQHAMASVVRAVSPFEIPDPAGHHRDAGDSVDPDRDGDASGEAPSTSDETVPPDGSAPSGISSPRLDGTDPAPADGSVPTTVPSGTAPASQEPRADIPSGAPTEVPSDQPRNTPTTEPGSVPVDGGVPTTPTQPDHTSPPSGDPPGRAPEEGSGGAPETPPTTQPATTQPAAGAK